uniref:Uncharacterized protein n=1 Tax=Chelydra serpentina TaxID=8475 RepID=A0A8C3XLI7_CHESE
MDSSDGSHSLHWAKPTPQSPDLPACPPQDSSSRLCLTCILRLILLPANVVSGHLPCTISSYCGHHLIPVPRCLFQAAREKLQNSIFDRMNVHNVLLYEVKRRGGMLEGLQRKLFSCPRQPSEATQDPSVLQVIRQLENNIEKMLMKIRTGEKIYYLYLKMVDFLKDVSFLPLYDLPRLPNIPNRRIMPTCLVLPPGVPRLLLPLLPGLFQLGTPESCLF